MDDHVRRQDDRDHDKRQADQAARKAWSDAQGDLIASTNSWDALLGLPEAMGMVPEGTLARIDAEIAAERRQKEAARREAADLVTAGLAQTTWATAAVPVAPDPAPAHGVLGSFVLDLPPRGEALGVRLYFDGRLHAVLPGVSGMAVPLASRERPLALGDHQLTIQFHPTWLPIETPAKYSEAWTLTYRRPGRYETRVSLTEAGCDVAIAHADSAFRVHRDDRAARPPGSDLVRLGCDGRVVGAWLLALDATFPVVVPGGRHTFTLERIQATRDAREPYRVVQRFDVEEEVAGPCQLFATYDPATGGLEEGSLLILDA